MSNALDDKGFRSPKAIAWLSARMIVAVAVTSAVCSWGYTYWYEVAACSNLVVTPSERLQDFLTTAIGCGLFGLFPAFFATFVQVSSRRRSWRRTLAATTIPNAAMGLAAALGLYLAGMGSLSAPIASIVATIGSATFFLALAWPYRSARVATLTGARP